MRLDPAFLDAVKEACAIEDVAARFVKLKRAGREYVGLSPFNAEKTPSFCVVPAKRFWHDFSSGKSGNVFDLLTEIQGLSFPEAVEQCARDAGLEMPVGWRSGPHRHDPAAEARKAAERRNLEAQRANREAREASRAKSIREQAFEDWRSGVEVSGTLAERYLAARGLDLGQFPRSLRYCASLEHRAGNTDGRPSRHPALVGAVRDPSNGRFLSLWRIFIDPARLDGALHKLGLGSYTEQGGSCWLGQPTECANVCEGIETGLAIWAMLGQKQGVQASLSTSGMAAFVPPKGCSRVLIWPDYDADRIKIDAQSGAEKHTASPGLTAAYKLRDRLKAAGVPVSIQPGRKDGKDWLDIYNAAKRLERLRHGGT